MRTNLFAKEFAFTIPPGAATGPITVAVNSKSAASATPLTIVLSRDFALTALPAAADLIKGQSASFAVSLTSNNGFSQLAALSVSGLPVGVTGLFKPEQVTAGQQSVLTLATPASQPISVGNLTISAAATVDGEALNNTTTVGLRVVAPTTSFIGRTVVDDAAQTPLAGVSVSMLGKNGQGGVTGCSGATTSDAAGNFALTSLTAACTGPQLVGFDGLTASAPPGKYAGVNLIYTFTAGSVTASPVLVHLPRIDDKETFLVKQDHSQDQTYAFSSIPGLSVTVYKNTIFTMPDGTQPDPFPLVGVRVPIDRLPDYKAPVPTMMLVFIVAFQPANSKASRPAAVYYPNTINNSPGENMPLLTLDPTRGTMVPYGTGTVSADGRQIVPDPDPAYPGARYGLVNFDWHGPMGRARNQSDPCNRSCGECARAGDPVDVATGLMVINEVDLSIRGPRGNLELIRTYRNAANPANFAIYGGPFGWGTNHNYGHEINEAFFATAAQINLVMPDGNWVPFGKNGDGKFTSGDPVARGAVLSITGSDNLEIRWKDGAVYKFGRRSNGGPPRVQLDSILDANGNEIRLQRHGLQIEHIFDSVGRRISLYYNSDGYIKQIEDSLGRKVDYTYGCCAPQSADALRTVRNPEGGTTRYDYSTVNSHAAGAGHLTLITDPRGVPLISNSLDNHGHVIEQRRADGSTLKFEYTLSNPTVGMASPITQTVVTDGRGFKTTYRFDSNRSVLSVTDPLGQVREFSRDGAGQITKVGGPGACGLCGDSGAGDTSYSYDGLGNLASRTDALGNVWQYTYEPQFSRVKTVRDPAGNVTQLAYDFNGNLTSITDARLNVTRNTYGSFGLIASTVNALGKTTQLKQDSVGNIAQLLGPLGIAAGFRYDAISRLIETTDPIGRKSSTAYDGNGRVTSSKDGKGGVTRFQYDLAGNLLELTDAKGQKTTFTYEIMGRLATRTDPSGRADARTYDAEGNVIRFVDRRGQVSTFTYDEINRLVSSLW